MRNRLHTTTMINAWRGLAPAAGLQPIGREQLGHRHLPRHEHAVPIQVPASAFVPGLNRMAMSVIGSAGSSGGFLFLGCSYDCVERY